MPTTIFTGTFSPGAVNVNFQRQNVGSPAVNGIDEVVETILISGEISDGSVALTFADGGLQTTANLSSPYPTDYDTAISDAASQLLDLDPTKTYTLTITED